jgi:hypothetical protein
MLSHTVLKMLWYCIIVVSPEHEKVEDNLEEWGQFIEFD